MSNRTEPAQTSAEVKLVRSRLATSVSKLKIARLFLAPIIDTIVSKATSFSSEEFAALIENEQSICSIPYTQFREACRASSIVSEVNEELQLDNEVNFFPIQQLLVNVVGTAQSERVNVDKDLMKQLVNLHEMITDTIQRLKDGSYSVYGVPGDQNLISRQTVSIYKEPQVGNVAPSVTNDKQAAVSVSKDRPAAISVAKDKQAAVSIAKDRPASVSNAKQKHATISIAPELEKDFVVLDDKPTDSQSDKYVITCDGHGEKCTSCVEEKLDKSNTVVVETKEKQAEPIVIPKEKPKPTVAERKRMFAKLFKTKPGLFKKPEVMHEPVNEYIGDTEVLKKRMEKQLELNEEADADTGNNKSHRARKPKVRKHLFSPSAHLPYIGTHEIKNRLRLNDKPCLVVREKLAALKRTPDEVQNEPDVVQCALEVQSGICEDEQFISKTDLENMTATDAEIYKCRSELTKLRQMYNELATVVDLLKQGQSTNSSIKSFVVDTQLSDGSIPLEDAMKTQIEILRFLKELDQIKELLRKLDNPELTIDMSVAGKTPCCELGDYPHIHAMLNGVRVVIKLNQTTVDVLLTEHLDQPKSVSMHRKVSCECAKEETSRKSPSTKQQISRVQQMAVPSTHHKWQESSTIYRATASLSFPQRTTSTAADDVTETNNKRTAVSVPNDRQAAVSATKNRRTAVSLPNDKQAAVSVAKDKKAAVSVTNDKQAAVSVTKDKQAAVSVTNDKQAAVSVTNDKQAAVSVSKDRPAAVSVAKDKQADISVTNDRLAAASVTNDRQAAKSVANDKQAAAINDAQSKVNQAPVPKKSAVKPEAIAAESSPSLPYFVTQKSLPNMNVCRPLRVSIEALKLNMRPDPLKNPPDNIRRQLKAFGIDNLVRASMPASCCRPAVIDEREMADEPYHASLNSLPLTASDIQVIGQVVGQDTPKSTALLHPYTFQYHATFQESLRFRCNRVYEVRFFEIFRPREYRQKMKVADVLRRFIYGAGNGGDGGSEGPAERGRSSKHNKRCQTVEVNTEKQQHKPERQSDKVQRHETKREKKKKKKSSKHKMTQSHIASTTEIFNASHHHEHHTKSKDKSSNRKKKTPEDNYKMLRKVSTTKGSLNSRTFTQVSSNVRHNDAHISEWIDTITESEVKIKENTIHKKSSRSIIPIKTPAISAFPKISTTVYTCETKGTHWLDTIHETEEKKKNQNVLNKKYECFYEFLRSPEITASFQRFITSDTAMRLIDRGGLSADQFWNKYFEAKRLNVSPKNSAELLPRIQPSVITSQPKVGRRKKLRSKSGIPRRVNLSATSTDDSVRKNGRPKKRINKGVNTSKTCECCTSVLQNDVQRSENLPTSNTPPKNIPPSTVKSSNPSLTYLASQNGPGYISVLHPICGCPEVSIFIPCYCDDSRSSMKCEELTQIGIEQLKQGSHGQHVILRKNCRVGKVTHSSLTAPQSEVSTKK